MQSSQTFRRTFSKLSLAILSLALASSLPTPVRASLVVYDWVQGNQTGIVEGAPILDIGHGETSTGTLTYDTASQTITSYSFSARGVVSVAMFDDTSVSPNTSSVILSDGNLLISAPPTGAVSYASLSLWDGVVGSVPSANENYLNISGNTAYLTGDWVPSVPEPTTAIAAALLLLPFGASALRILRNKEKNSACPQKEFDAPIIR